MDALLVIEGGKIEHKKRKNKGRTEHCARKKTKAMKYERKRALLKKKNAYKIAIPIH